MSKLTYGINFPTPSEMRVNTSKKQGAMVQKELIEILSKMKDSTSYSISLNKLSVDAQNALAELGYKVVAYVDQWDHVLSYSVQWEPDSNNNNSGTTKTISKE